MLAALVVAWSGFRTFTPDDASGRDLVSLLEITPEAEQSLQTDGSADSGALPTWLAPAAVPVWARTSTARVPRGPQRPYPLRHLLCVYRL